jgi:hypothetical protein
MEESCNVTAIQIYALQGPRYPLNRWLFGLYSWSGKLGEEKDFLPLLVGDTRIILPIFYSSLGHKVPLEHNNTYPYIIAANLIYYGKVTIFSTKTIRSEEISFRSYYDHLS